MACKYYVNGNWVTEDQLKEILNNGLLDNLVSSEQIKLAGFRPDPAKLLKTTTQTIALNTVPAVKLAEILTNEVKTRQGYPMNMLASLELNEDKTDFKIPLWASPYAQKFESLLTSIISKKVIKTKAPGNSYVLGSQEGFKIKEGDAAAGKLKDSGIVFSQNFDPKEGLLPARYDEETGTILPDQIMVPFKFRDEVGKILNLKDFVVEGEDGRMMMDTNKIPEKLLKLFGYRIPTGGRNQMASVEIVGFLPETSGDLILAPRDFTKRMGSDFDVDKLYAYNYNHFYDSKSGQIKTNFLSDKKKIDAAIEVQKDRINNLKKELKLSKAETALIEDYINRRIYGPEEEADFIETKRIEEAASEIIKNATNANIVEEIEYAFDILSVLKRSYKAARENNIQDIRLQILGSTNPEILASNFSLDSYGDFESLAPMVEAIREKRGLVPEISSILSDTYQRNKYINATAGKDGVGSFSLDSTFNATVQGKDLVIQNLTEENYEALFGTFESPRKPSPAELLAANNPIAIFGTSVSKGDLSNKYTLRSQALIQLAKEENRSLTAEEKKSLKLKSTIIKNLQSTSVDNEKFQILDKLNINNNTFDAIRAMTMLGFEEQDIAGLLTQEIMWEYLTQLRNSQSSLVAYNPDIEEDIFQALLEKYDPENRFGQLSDEDKQQWASESGEQLIKNLETQTLKPLEKNDKTLDFNLKQIAILQKFRNLTEVGKEIKKLQSTINTSSKGLPKSLLELQSKVRQIDNLPFSPIYNAENLLGEYTKDMFGVRLTKPTTINGFASFYGAKFADPLFNRYFPYSQEGFTTAINEVMTHMPNALDKSLAKQTEMTRDIFNDIRSFLYANTNSKLFGDDPTVEQRRLFIDVVKGPNLNMSLAKILQNLSKENWFMKNGFLNKLSFDINKNGNISRINFEAATAENLDERNIFDGFLYLLDKNFPVGTFNGIEYTSRTLAQDLVAAAFLEGGTQGAKQYLKYVPASYLKTLGFGDYLGAIPFNFEETFYGVVTDGGELFYNIPSRFTRQYFQNNPDKVKTISSGDIKGNPKKLENEFSLTVEAIAKNLVTVTDPLTGEPKQEQTKFVSIYDPKLPGKYALYEFDNSSRTYKRLPVLSGSYGFVQYNSNRDISNPIEGPNQIQAPKGPDIESPGYSIPAIPVQPVRGFNPDVVNNTKQIENAADLVLSKNLSGTGMALDDLLNTLEDADGVSKLNQILLNQLRDLKLPEGFKLEYIRASEQKLGGYDYTSKTLQINLNALPNMTVDELAGLVAHELIHTHTGHAINDYQDGKLDKLTKEQIDIIQRLEALQQAYIQYLESIGAGPELEAFTESYKKWKKTKEGGVVGDVSKLYGAMKLTEFVTMALTDQAFQNHLKNIVDEEGLSIWDRIKQMLSELLQAMGLDIPAGSALASTIKSTMDLISETQKTIPTKTTTESFKYYGAYYDIKVVDGVAVDVTNLKKSASETNVKFDERKNKILSAFKENPSVDPQSRITAPALKTSEQVVEDLFTQVGGRKTSKGLLEVNGQHWYIDNSHWKIEFKDGRDELFFYPDSGEEIYIGERPTGTKNFTINPQLQATAEATASLTERQIKRNRVQVKTIFTDFDLDEQSLFNEPTVEKYETVISNLEFDLSTDGLSEGLRRSIETKLQDIKNSFEIIEPNKSIRKTYSGKVTNLQPNQVFVFGSNPLGINGNPAKGTGGAALVAYNIAGVKQGEKMDNKLSDSGQAWGITTVTGPGNKRSKTPQEITEGIKKLYEYAKQNPAKEFLISDYSGTNLNGYTGQEMADMFANAGPIPSNIVFNENFNKLIDENVAEVPWKEDVKETPTPISVAPIVENEIVDPKYELFPGVYANAGQRQAIDALNNFLVSRNRSFLLQGKGGTGKTTIIKKVLAGLNPREVLAIGPTHKAKDVLDNSINPPNSRSEKIRAITLSSALAINLNETTGKFTPDTYKRNKNQVPIKKFKYIVIDESSMISDKLLEEIMQFAAADAKIIFMGDKAQLPPVSQEKDSAVFSIENGYELKQKMRQAATSPIINIGTVVSENVESTTGRVSNPITQEMRVNSYDEASGSSVLWEKSEAKAIDQFVSDFLASNGDLNYAKIITFNNQISDNSQSVQNLNKKVRAKLFGLRATTEQFIPGEIVTAYDGFSFERGVDAVPEFDNSEDLLVQSSAIKLNEPITIKAKSEAKGERELTLNFDVNYVTLVNKKGKVISNIPVIASSSKAEFEKAVDQLIKTDPQLGYVLKDKFANLQYGYAITSHKSQGSTYKNVYVMEDNIMSYATNAGSVKAKNQSLYVAVSRPTTKLVMVSTKNPGTTAAPVAAKFDPSKLSDPSRYSTPPVEDDYNSEMDDYYSNREDRENYMDDYMNEYGDEMLQTSPINRSDYENYLLICGK